MKVEFVMQNLQINLNFHGHEDGQEDVRDGCGIALKSPITYRLLTGAPSVWVPLWGLFGHLVCQFVSGTGHSALQIPGYNSENFCHNLVWPQHKTQHSSGYPLDSGHCRILQTLPSAQATLGGALRQCLLTMSIQGRHKVVWRRPMRWILCGPSLVSHSCDWRLRRVRENSSFSGHTRKRAKDIPERKLLCRRKGFSIQSHLPHRHYRLQVILFWCDFNFPTILEFLWATAKLPINCDN